jgi:hypothetical protein
VSDVAAFVAWLGAAVVVLADGRRGLAAGLALVGLAMAGVAWAAGDQLGAILLLAGGLIGAGLRFFIGPDGWGLMEPGSTPRMLFAVVAGLFGLWVAAAVTTGGSGGLRFAAFAGILLLGGRLLQAAAPVALLTAIAGVALVLGVISGAVGGTGGNAEYAIAAAVCAAVSAMPATARHSGT